MSKGSKRRKKSVSHKEFTQNWDNIFNRGDNAQQDNSKKTT